MKEYESPTAFFDLLFNILCCFVVLFSLAFILMSEENKAENKVESTAEFLITVTWPDKCGDDVDTYVEDPLGNLVSFSRREEGLMHLDRDDLGNNNDVIKAEDGTTYQVDENKEVVTVRGIIPGEYVATAHMYFKRTDTDTPVNIKLEKINPRLSVVTMEEVVLQNHKDEKTAFRFTIDEEGIVTDTNRLEKRLATSTQWHEEYE
jgi:hypothetical protein